MWRARLIVLASVLALAACAKPNAIPSDDLIELPPVPPQALTGAVDAAGDAPAVSADPTAPQAAPINAVPPATFVEAAAHREGEWIAEATTYHSDELPEAVPETVFALVSSDRGSHVVKAKLMVTPVLPDGAEALPPDGDRQARVVDLKTGQALEARLIMNVAGVKAGAQRALNITPQNTPDPGDRATVRVQWGEEALVVRLRDAPVVPNPPACVILVEYQGVRQVVQDDQCTFDVETSPLTAEQLAGLFWFGDLDRDRRPDVIYKPLGHYNAMDTQLLLSSRARPGRLFAIAASMHAVGC